MDSIEIQGDFQKCFDLQNNSIVIILEIYANHFFQTSAKKLTPWCGASTQPWTSDRVHQAEPVVEFSHVKGHGPQQVEQSDQAPSCQGSRWCWRDGDHRSSCVCVRALACTHMWAKIGIFGQKSLCSWKIPPCWIIPGYARLDGALLVLLLPYQNPTLANGGTLQSQRLCWTQSFTACSTTPNI